MRCLAHGSLCLWMRKFVRWIESYLFGVKLGEYHSAVSGTLELWYINGRKMVNAPNVNYSFGNLHRVFLRVFSSQWPSEYPNLHAPKKVLILGFGAGSVAHILHRHYRFDSHITGVDLDPVMLQLAQDEFGQKPSTKLRLFTADAVDFVASDTRIYDMVVIDIFVDDQVPDAIVSRPFLDHVLNRMEPGARLYINLMTHTEKFKWQQQQLRQLADRGSVQFLHPLRGNVVFYFRKR